jgi:hypothetical protein
MGCLLNTARLWSSVDCLMAAVSDCRSSDSFNLTTLRRGMNLESNHLKVPPSGEV